MLHWVAWVLARLVYRLRVVGRDHVPSSGGVLLVSNHVSYVDWLAIMGGCPRPVRFVIASNFIHNPIFGWVLRLVRVIPLDRTGGPKSLQRSLKAAAQALANGEVVCVFPESYPTRNGVMLPFRRGFERLVESTSIPVVPVYLDQLWGSIFSYFDGRLFWKWPQRRKYPVTVAFGKPQDSTVTAPQVRQMIQQMAADVAKERTRTILPVHRQFVRSAARHPFRPCLIDTTSGPEPVVLNRGKALAGAMCLARWLRPKLGDEPMVGVWLPQSAGGVLTNVALTLLHKTPVNLNYTAGTDNVRSAARQCELKVVLSSKRFLTRYPLDLGPDVRVIAGEDARDEITTGRRLAAYLRTILLPGWLLDRLLGLGGHESSDLATVIFSSGSTGEPKGVMLTHQNVAANIEAFIDYVRFTHHDRVLGILPFFHSFGYTVTLWGALLAEARTVFHP
ncbi:MAG TPA: AMP-binding protein, partial [Gemmataceae bacterium]